MSVVLPGTGGFLDHAVKLTRDWDASRPRSLQKEPGWSEVGGCRSYLGFRLSGAWASDDPDSWGAIRGTAIHTLMEEVLRDVPGVRTEVVTRYRGIPGHADLIVIDDTSVTDHKTTKLANSRVWQEKPSALRQKRIQAHGYAAGLIEAGELPETATVRLLVIPVDGTFADWWAWEEPFDRSLADEGADRLEWVREKLRAGEALPKDEPYRFCESWCLAGETEVVTGHGIHPISDLAGGSHPLLVPTPHGHGQWQECEVRSFGNQALMAVTLRRLKTSKTIYATAEHQWITKDGAILRTSDLAPGTRLRSLRRNNTAGLAEVPFAVAQGFVYGDGSLPADKGVAASLPFYEKSPKPKTMLGYFAAHDVRYIARDERTGGDGWFVPMLPRSWKAAPDLSETRSFLVSWLAGYIAADGHVDTGGNTTISSSRHECADLVRSVCAITGIGYSPVQTRARRGYGQTEPSNLYAVALRTRDLPEWAFKHDHHRQRAEMARAKQSHDINWVVESVARTDRAEEVFCPVVPGSEAFALADELLTHNCQFFGQCRGQDDPDAAEDITDPELVAAVAAYGEAAQQATALDKDKKRLASLIRGLRGTAGEWRISLGKPGDPSEVLDEEWIRADYAARGEPVPVTEKPGNAPRLSVSRIRKAAAK